jgi:energy-coupling factor transporter transmembrane protein EcfT
MDPRTKLGLMACLGVLVVLLDSPVSLTAVTLVALAPLPFLSLDKIWVRRGWLAALAMTWSTMLSQGLFYGDLPRVPLVELGPLVVYREGVVYGLVQSLRFVALSVAGVAVVTSTPVDRLLAALLRLRVPFGLAFLAVTALRFVPTTAQDLVAVRQARARRGRPAHARAPWAWLSLEVSLLRPVIARSLRRARVLAESLDARGFDPLAHRAARRPMRMAAWEIGLLGAAGSVSLLVAGAQLLYVLYTAEILWFPGLRGLYGFVRTWL